MRLSEVVLSLDPDYGLDDRSREQTQRQRIIKPDAKCPPPEPREFTNATPPIVRSKSAIKASAFWTRLVFEASIAGLIPREHSSGSRQKLGPISKQGNPLVRWLLVEAAGVATRSDTELRQDYLRLAYRKNRSLAKIAIARKLAVRLYWMLRTGTKYPLTVGSCAG